MIDLGTVFHAPSPQDGHANPARVSGLLQACQPSPLCEPIYYQKKKKVCVCVHVCMCVYCIGFVVQRPD